MWGREAPAPRLYIPSAMAKAICRVGKIGGQGSAGGKDAHNKREKETLNADGSRRHLNKEYVNVEGKPMWETLNERIEQAGVKRKVRGDAVRGMEFILTASPDHFKRDSSGIAEDVRQSAWVAQNLKFMQERYGKNLVGFMLHQDEKTPHVHAIVVPITPDGRLSAKEMFNPRTLRQLQNDYARSMQGFGLERGQENSRVRHRPSKHIYGQVEAVEQELKQPEEPFQPVKLDPPSTRDLFHLTEWAALQEERINEEAARQWHRQQELAKKAKELAIHFATANERARIMEQKLQTAQQLQQKNFETAKAQGKVLDTLAIRQAQGEPLPSLARRYEQVRAREMPGMVAQVEKLLKAQPIESQQVAVELIRKHFWVRQNESNGRKSELIEDKQTGIRININQDAVFSGSTLAQRIGQVVSLTQQQIERQKQQERQQEADRQEAARQKAEQQRLKEEQQRKQEAARQEKIAQQREKFVSELTGELVGIVKRGQSRTIEQALTAVSGSYRVEVNQEKGVLIQSRTGKGPVVNISQVGQPKPILEQLRERVELNVAQAQERKLAQQQQPKRQVRPRLG